MTDELIVKDGAVYFKTGFSISDKPIMRYLFFKLSLLPDEITSGPAVYETGRNRLNYTNGFKRGAVIFFDGNKPADFIEETEITPQKTKRDKRYWCGEWQYLLKSGWSKNPR